MNVEKVCESTLGGYHTVAAGHVATSAMSFWVLQCRQLVT